MTGHCETCKNWSEYEYDSYGVCLAITDEGPYRSRLIELDWSNKGMETSCWAETHRTFGCVLHIPFHIPNTDDQPNQPEPSAPHGSG